MVILRTLAAAAVLCAAGSASAHVSLTPQTAPAGAYQVLRFGVGHGCEGKATTALRVEIPAGVAIARPQPKPGWTLRIEHPADKAEAVSAIVWQGGLPPDQFDEFLILTRLPATEGPLAFPTVQTCGADEVRWTDTAPPGAARPQHPAPSLILTPAAAAPEAGHDHHH
jgi:uncharacterized protein YcnI